MLDPNIFPHEAASGLRLDSMGELYDIKRKGAEEDRHYRERILGGVNTPKPRTIGEHLTMMAKIHRFFTTE